MNELAAVVTIQEAAKIFYKAENTIRHHIDRGNVEWRQAGKVYLISLASLINLYGEPVQNLSLLHTATIATKVI